MGHREDLLAGAQRCLLEKGFARTTARDIVAASGTNLASIGYHYGSKEALLVAAYVQAIKEWDTGLPSAVAGVAPEPGADPLDRFEAVWNRIIEVFPANRRLWALSSEITSQADRLPEVRRALAKAQPEGWAGLVALFHGVDESTVDEKTARTLGTFYAALLNGVMMQYLFDPESAPTARELAEAMRTVAADTGAAGGR